MFKNMFSWLLFISCLVGLSASSCSDTEIPQTPEAPFALTRIWILNDAIPPFGTPLVPGTNVSFTFIIVYTLSAEDEADLDNRNVGIDLHALDALRNRIEIGTFPDDFIALDANADVIFGSLTMNIPFGAAVVRLVAAIADDNNQLVSGAVDASKSWPVQ